MQSDASYSAYLSEISRRSKHNSQYGVLHRRLRREYGRLVAAGLAHCARCGEWISPGPWDLGHRDDGRGYSGPEHVVCNRGAPNRNNTSREW